MQAVRDAREHRMRFEWDADKRRSNIDKHGLDFVDAQKIFDGRPRFDRESPRGDEQRCLSIAMLRDKLVAVVWTVRGTEVVRVISARRARNEEERQYRQLHG